MSATRHATPSPDSALVSRFSLAVLSLATVLAGVGCQTPVREAPKVAHHGPCRPSPKIVEPLHSPRAHKKDFTHPFPFTRHSFAWNHEGCLWSINVPVIHEASASVVFTKAYDLSQSRDSKWVTLELKPAFMAEHLILEFEDGSEDPQTVSLGRPLSDYQVRERGDWGTFLIRCDEFSKADAAELDWTQIHGVKLTRMAEEGPETLVMVRRLQFQSDAYFIPQI